MKSFLVYSKLVPCEEKVLTESVHIWEFFARFASRNLFLQSNFDGSNIFGTIENCLRHGWFELLRVNYGAVRKQMAII